MIALWMLTGVIAKQQSAVEPVVSRGGGFGYDYKQSQRAELLREEDRLVMAVIQEFLEVAA
jgi:hypothetical protein